jgi:hypothetical protein
MKAEIIQAILAISPVGVNLDKRSPEKPIMHRILVAVAIQMITSIIGIAGGTYIAVKLLQKDVDALVSADIRHEKGIDELKHIDELQASQILELYARRTR